MMEKPVIAASTYLNSAPLCYSFLRGSQRAACSFIPNTAPATCAELLREGDVDAALIPAIEYQRIEGIGLIPGLAVAAERQVRSVLLASLKPLEDIETIALDTSSRTSAALIKIIFRRFLRRSPRYMPWSPNLDEMLRIADGALIIGDPALCIAFHRRDLRIYDCAELWYRMTEFPIVFAVWAVRVDRWAKLRNVSFEAAKQEGVEHIPDIVRSASRELRLPIPYLESYFAECVVYDLDERKRAGLDLFYALAAEEGLVARRKKIEFLFACEASTRNEENDHVA